MRISLFMLLTIFLFIGAAEAQSINRKPKDLVASKKAKNKAFKTVQLFELAEDKSKFSDKLEKGVNKYEILNLNTEALTKTLKEAPEVITLSLPSFEKSKLELELVKVNIFRDDFSVIESDTRKPTEVDLGTHYRGIIKGEEHSIAAISFQNNEVQGLISSDAGNLVLGKLNGLKSTTHILYDDQEVLKEIGFSCGMEDDHAPYTTQDLEAVATKRGLDDCVGVYLEVDNDIYNNKGGTQGATNYITGVMNQVITLYANESINAVVSEIFVWSSPSPYTSSSSSGQLNQFQANTGSFNGDLAMLVSYKASGGIAAGFSGLCNSNPDNSKCFSSISSGYNTVPTYSFTVMVSAHELGHLWGSRHTHACVWNGNNTAIDGCAGAVEGGCPLPGAPSSGGTIMSYCHLQSVGINFNNGFGPQPGNVVRNRTANANCLQACDNGSGNDDDEPCEANEVQIRIKLDNYPEETTWVLSAGGSEVASGGPYGAQADGTTLIFDLCLEDDCYTFTINDAYGDGICCGYGIGDYEITDVEGNTLAVGGEFASSESTEFCLPENGGGDDEPDPNECIEIVLDDYTIDSYGGGQDNGSSTLLTNNTVLRIQNNAWKSIDFEYIVTENTVIEFDFGATLQGEIHGIGFDDNNSISSNYTFRLFGTQNWGISNFDNYSGSIGNWKSYSIPIGEFYTGEFSRLFFVADHDSSPGNGNSYFRNLRIHEGGGCSTNIIDGTVSLRGDTPLQLRLFPNPATENLTIALEGHASEKAQIQIYSITGQLVHTVEVLLIEGLHQESLNISQLTQGAYIMKISTGTDQLTSKFNVSR